MVLNAEYSTQIIEKTGVDRTFGNFSDNPHFYLFYWAPAELPVNSYGLRPYKKRSESCDFLIEHLDLSTRRLHCVIEVIRIEKGQVGCDHGEAEFPEAHGQCDGEVHGDCQE